MKGAIRLSFLLALIIPCACFNREDKEFVYRVPEQYQTYVNTFLAAASARGHDLRIDNLIIEEGELEPKYCGVCNSRSMKNDIQKTVTLRITPCWENEQQLECLIFHELGHCVLGRDHEEGLLPNGIKKSLMTGDDITLYSPCVYDIGGSADCNKYPRREYYLDELFQPMTPTPAWGQ